MTEQLKVVSWPQRLLLEGSIFLVLWRVASWCASWNREKSDLIPVAWNLLLLVALIVLLVRCSPKTEMPDS